MHATLAPAPSIAPAATDAILRRYRYHDPVIGRFTSFDSFEAPISDPVSLHKYNYANGDPINNVDPTGMFSLSNLLVTSGITGLVSASVTGAYGYAKGWSTGQIARASTYAFFAGAVGSAAAYGIAWGVAAGAAVSSGLVAAEAAGYSAIGWTTAGLIGSPTTLGLAIKNNVDVANDPNADGVDRAFARFNLAVSALVFLGSHAQTLAIAQGMTVPMNPGPQLTRTIQEIKALPATQQLTPQQLSALRTNVDLLKGVVRANNNTQAIASRIKLIISTDSRFAGLTQAQRDAFAIEVQQMVR